MPINPSSKEISQWLRNYQATGTAQPDETTEIENPDEQKVQEQHTEATLRWRPSGVIADIRTQEALESGFGTSKYDSDYIPDKDIETARALSQSGFSKIGTGLMKGGVTAATTAVNTTVGTVFGVGAALYEMMTDAEGDGRSIRGTLDAGVNNWLSNQLLKIQQWSEDQFPNYRTAEERSEQYQKEWYKPSHFFSANNIGDNILKNFGFTVGAMVGGMGWSRLIGAGLSKQLASNIMKGAVVAAEGDAEVGALMKSAADAIKVGESQAAKQALKRAGEAVGRSTLAAVDANAIKANIESAAKAINRYGAQLQLYGAAVGAMGEGTVEGLMARDEFMQDFERSALERFKTKSERLEEDVLSENNADWMYLRIEDNGDGNPQIVPELTEAGKAEVERRRKELTAEYRQLMEAAEQEGNRLASTTFLLNLPILTTTNLVEFGKMFSGGWKTSKTISGLTGGITENEGKIAANYGVNKATENLGLQTVLGSLKVGGSEAFEEMAQGTVSSGAKKVAGVRLGEYNNDGYDPEAVDSVREWFSEMYAGGAEYLSDIKNWQEGAIGGLTGLFGIPGKRWGGGVIGAYQEARDNREAARNAAAKLNELVNSEEFQNKWHGYIRHLKYDNDMSEALAKNDEYSWHNAEDNQVISDVMTFASAGRLEDLNQIVDHFANINESDAAGIKAALGEDSWAKNLSDREVVDKVKEQADKLKDTIKEYKDVYQALSAIAPQGTSDKHLKEMIFTAMQIKAFDARFLKMFGETMDALDNPLLEVARRDDSGKFVKKEEQLAKFREWRDALESLIGKNVLIPVIPEQLEEALNQLSEGTYNDMLRNNPEAQQKLKDMLRLAASRRQFYKKLQTLQNLSSEKVEESMITPDKVEEAAETELAKRETEGLNSLDDVKKAYFEIKHVAKKAEWARQIEPARTSNPHVDTFLKMRSIVEGAKEYVDSHDLITDNSLVSNLKVRSMIDSALSQARSEEELYTLPDDILQSWEDFKLMNTNAFGHPSHDTYVATKEAARQMMSAYLRERGIKTTQESLSPQPVAQQSTTGNSTTQAGYDAAQPASMEPAPKAQTNPEPAENHNENEEQPKEQKETPAEEPVVTTPTAEQTMSDATIASQEDEERAEQEVAPHEKGKRDKLIGGRTSMPEISTEEAKGARKDIKNKDRESLKTRDLSDFPEYLKHQVDHYAAIANDESRTKAEREAAEEQRKKFQEQYDSFTPIWNYLNGLGAFAATAKVKVGEEIEFVVDPTFPKYKNEKGGEEYNILIRRKSDGQVLNILSRQTSLYYGLEALRSAIDKEYKDFIDKNPNDVFVFSKTSRIYMKRAGLIDYDFSRKTDDYSEEDSIANRPGYEKEAPIVFIDRNGEARVVRGDRDAASKVSADFNNAQRNKGDYGDGIDRRGGLYYLTEAPNGQYEYVPIRLWVEHFNSKNKDREVPQFNTVRDILSEISEKVKNVTEDTLAQTGSDIHKLAQRLGEILDIHDIDFVFRDFGGSTGVALAINKVGPDGQRIEGEGKMFTPAQISAEKLIDHIAGLNRSINIKLNSEGKISDLNGLIENGMITTNARMMRPKGTDFYYWPWSGDYGEFLPATDLQRNAISEAIDNGVAAPSATDAIQNEKPQTEDNSEEPEGYDDIDEDGELTKSTDQTPSASTEQQEEANKEAQTAITGRRDRDPSTELIGKPFAELPAETQEQLKAKGYTEESYNEEVKTRQLLQEKTDNCSGA